MSADMSSPSIGADSSFELSRTIPASQLEESMMNMGMGAGLLHASGAKIDEGQSSLLSTMTVSITASDERERARKLRHELAEATHKEKQISFHPHQSFGLQQASWQLFSKNHVMTSENSFTCHVQIAETHQLVCGTHDGPLILFHKKTPYAMAQVSDELKGHIGIVTCLTYDASLDMLFSGSGDRTVRVWDLKQDVRKMCVQTIHGHEGTITAISVMAGAFLVTASTDCSVRVWSSGDDEGRARFRYAFFHCVHHFTDFKNCWVNALVCNSTRFLRDSLLFVGDSAGDVHVFRPIVRTTRRRSSVAALLGAATGGEGRSSTMAVLPNEEVTFRRVAHWPRIHKLGISRMAFASRDNFLVTLSFDNTVRVTDTSTGKRFASLAHPKGIRWVDVAFNSLLMEAVMCDEHGDVTLWAVYSQQPPYMQALGRGPLTSISVRENVRSEAQHVDGEFVVTCLESAESWRIFREMEWIDFTGHTAAVVAVVYLGSPTGEAYDERIVSVSLDNTMRFWNPRDMRETQTFAEPLSEISSLTFARQSNTIITGHENGFICFWNPETGTSVRIRAHDNTVTCLTVCIIPYGRVMKEAVVSGSFDGRVGIWNIGRAVSNENKPEPLRMIDTKHGEVLAVAFTKHGAIASGGTNGAISLWSTNGRELASMTRRAHTDAVTCLAIDGNLLLSGSDDRTIRVWDSKSYIWLRTIEEAHTVGVRAIYMIPSTCFLASTAHDGEVRVWNYGAEGDANRLVKSFQHKSAEFTCLTYNKSKRELVAGNTHGGLMLFEIPTELLEEPSMKRQTSVSLRPSRRVFIAPTVAKDHDAELDAAMLDFLDNQDAYVNVTAAVTPPRAGSQGPSRGPSDSNMGSLTARFPIQAHLIKTPAPLPARNRMAATLTARTPGPAQPPKEDPPARFLEMDSPRQRQANMRRLAALSQRSDVKPAAVREMAEGLSRHSSRGSVASVARPPSGPKPSSAVRRLRLQPPSFH